MKKTKLRAVIKATDDIIKTCREMGIACDSLALALARAKKGSKESRKG